MKKTFDAFFGSFGLVNDENMLKLSEELKTISEKLENKEINFDEYLKEEKRINKEIGKIIHSKFENDYEE